MKTEYSPHALFCPLCKEPTAILILSPEERNSRQAQPGESLPDTRLCDRCDQIAQEVSAGGVAVKCTGCGAFMALKRGEHAKLIRDGLNKPAPEWLGLLVPDCPFCRKEMTYDDSQ